MYDREGFIDYVGKKSGISYARGLDTIEKMYSIGLDGEYAKDKCEELLATIQRDLQRTDIDKKEQGKRKTAERNLKRYLFFRVNVRDTITDRIHFVIDHYKSNFEKVDKDERYKWKAVGWYRKHWKIDAPNFAEMLESAFSAVSNLLASSQYFPNKMIVEYAKSNPEEVRRIFRALYTEQIPLEERYQLFQNSCNSWIANLHEEKALNHYQDWRAIMLYLTFEYPEKYYLYKSTMYSNFRERIGFREEDRPQPSVTDKLDSYFQMCELVLAEVNQDQELIAMHKARLDETCYDDKALHLLATDIVYYGSNNDYLTEENFWKRQIHNYWPSLEEYNPGITTEMWTAVLNDPAVTSTENLDMLQKMLKLGGESTCAHLAEVFGNTASYYNGLGSGFAGKVKKHFYCPDCVDSGGDTEERSRVYVVPFVGRDVIENGNKRYSWRLRDELKGALMRMEFSDPPTVESVTDVGLNTILYGPPGTGKTYHTVIYAVAIIENKKLSVVEKEDYAEVLNRYNEYKEQGRIEFTTFHQSYGYEEFIEGIRPIPPDDADGESGEIRYSVQPGVFKRFCEKAQRPAAADSDDYSIGDNPNIWKVSLGGAGDTPIRSDCLENNHIRIGWDEHGKDITDKTDFTVAGGRIVLNAFINKMQVGDIVLSCYSASTIDAIGVVTGEYEWHDEYPSLKRLRKVNWIVKGIRENILAINGGTSMTLASVYRLNVSLSDVYQIIEKHQPKQIVPVNARSNNYVFIIDEINRGNISKIFGELITLIEATKRVGCSEGMTVRLPYSQKLFGVPKNVYIIGTMNTADRSIATIDTALRRRFLFREMLPNPKILEGITVGELSISEMLIRMNQRIAALYDREHTIGHAYFMPLKASPTIETLAEIFTNNIIPLLQEYFYENYENIQLVLGDNQKPADEEKFIIDKENDYKNLFGNAEIDLDRTVSYEINHTAFYKPEAYRFI